MTSTLRAGLIGAGIGGASMFLLDPDRGARRRALLRDQAGRMARKTRDAAGTTRRDLGNRVSGLKSLAGVATGAVLIAAALARRNGQSTDAVARDARGAPPSPEQEAAEAFETEIGILIVGTAPTEPGTFATDEPSS